MILVYRRVIEGQDVSVIDWNQCGSLPPEANTDTESQPDIPASGVADTHKVIEEQGVSVIDWNQCGFLPPEVNTDTESQPDIPASGVAGTHRVIEGQDVSVIDGNQCGFLPPEVNTDTESQPDIPANTGSSALTGEDNEYVHKIQLADKRIFENTLRVNIGKAGADALVDTGATVSCISNNFLNTINPHYVRYLQPDIMTVFGVGNMAHEVSAKVELNFVIDGTEFIHIFHV